MKPTGSMPCKASDSKEAERSWQQWYRWGSVWAQADIAARKSVDE
jgi:hypothetical protein